MRYTTPEYGDGPEPGNSRTNRWWGIETSPAAWRNYLYVGDNGGRLMCIDLNTMTTVWVQDIVDDTNSSPLFEESVADGTGYIYIAPSLHITGSGNPPGGQISIMKINAATGEKVWSSQEYECYSRSGISGGVQGTGLLGQGDISNLVIYPVAGSPAVAPGLLVALDKATGNEVWRFTMGNYAWSSPVAVYTAEGKSYIVICDSVGTVYLLEGATGLKMSDVPTSTQERAIEATPVVYNNTIVIGTKGKRIYGITIK